MVSFYFPPAGGGGVQRPLKLAQYLPALGIETHVLAPDDPRWMHRDDGLRVPTQAWVHRSRYLGPGGGKPAEQLRGTQGLARATVYARLMGRRLLVPDESVGWNMTAIPAAIRLVRQHRIDWVITTSPPGSVHLIGAAVQRATGARWLADLRDSIVAHPAPAQRQRRVEGEGAAAWTGSRGSSRRGPTRSRASPMRSRTRRALSTRAARCARSPNGSDFDDFAGLEYHPGDRMRITHAGSFFGKRDPRPFLQALADSRARRRRALPRRLPPGRPRVGRGARARRPAGADPVCATVDVARAAA